MHGSTKRKNAVQPVDLIRGDSCRIETCKTVREPGGGRQEKGVPSQERRQQGQRLRGRRKMKACRRLQVWGGGSYSTEQYMGRGGGDWVLGSAKPDILPT